MQLLSFVVIAAFSAAEIGLLCPGRFQARGVA